MALSVKEASSLPSAQRATKAAGAEVSAAGSKVTVLMMPDYRHDNPYQTLLSQAIEADGSHVDFPRGYRRMFPIYRALRDYPAAQVLHLHWTAQYVRGKNRITFFVWAAKFLADLALVRLSGRKIVWTLHNLVPHETRFPRLEILVRRWLCKMASAVIVHGTTGREEVVKQIGCRPEKVFIVLQGNYINAYPPAPPRAAALEALGLKPCRKTVLFFGLVRPYKGIPGLLRAWRTVAPDDAQLVIAGACSEGYRAEINPIVAGAPNVIWHDAWISNEQLPQYFAIADVVVFPFERVLTSASVVLAMGFGKPIVAPRLGEIPETLAGADDLTYPSGDQDALASALRRALLDDLSDLEVRTLTAAQRFDWSAIGRTTANIYRQVLGLPTEQRLVSS